MCTDVALVGSSDDECDIDGDLALVFDDGIDCTEDDVSCRRRV